MSVIATPWDERVLVMRANVARESWFTETELLTASQFKLATRRDEWLQSRIAAKQLAMQLGLADDPQAITIERPSLVINGIATEWRVSLSHSAPYVGAAISHAPIGIDVQSIRELDERAAHLFLSPEETDQMLDCTLAHRILHFWCAKEAAWKQRSDEFATLRQIPLPLLEKRDDGLLFDAAETFLAGDVIVATTRPTS